MAEIDLEAFIAQVNSDRTHVSDVKNQLNRVWMNGDNLGNLSFLPIYSQKYKHIYTKIEGVYEYYTDTSKLKSGEGKYRILPIEFYGDLSEEEIALYDEVKSLLIEADNQFTKLYPNDHYKYLSVKYYSIFFGILQSLTRLEGKPEKDLVGCPCMFIYPTTNVINAFGDGINTMTDSLNGSRTWMSAVITTNLTNRQGVMNISFNPKPNNAVGYNASVSFVLNSVAGMVVDPNYVIPETYQDFYEGDDIVREFITWEYDNENKRPYDPIVFKELKDMLIMKLTELKGIQAPSQAPADAGKTYPNQNNLNPQAQPQTQFAQPTQPQVDPTTGQPKKQTPF